MRAVQLKQLCRIIDELFQIWVASHYSDNDTALKMALIKKVKKQLEEQERGFVSGKVDYAKMAEVIIRGDCKVLDFELLRKSVLATNNLHSYLVEEAS